MGAKVHIIFQSTKEMCVFFGILTFRYFGFSIFGIHTKCYSAKYIDRYNEKAVRCGTAFLLFLCTEKVRCYSVLNRSTRS